MLSYKITKAVFIDTISELSPKRRWRLLLPEIEAISRFTILPHDVLPVKTGIQTHVVFLLFLDSRFRGNDECDLFLVDSSVLFSFHPETPDVKLLVFNSETRDFSSWQGNQGVARRRTQVRRTSKPED